MIQFRIHLIYYLVCFLMKSDTHECVLWTKLSFSTTLINLFFLSKLWKIMLKYIYTTVTKMFMHNAGIFSYYVRKTIFSNSKYQCDERTRRDIAKAVIAHRRGLESVLLRTHIYHIFRSSLDRHSIQLSFVPVDLSRRYRTTARFHMLSSFCLLSFL